MTSIRDYAIPTRSTDREQAMTNRIYYRTDGGFDGNEDGVEWATGFAVFHVSADESEEGVEKFEVYEDDGFGNGGYVATFRAKADAVSFVNMKCGIAEAA